MAGGKSVDSRENVCEVLTVVRAELDVVLGLELDDVREGVAAREYEVLDDEIEGVVRVLDARKGHVANLVDNCRQDGTTDIVPELRLEREASLAVEEEVLRETRPILPEAGDNVRGSRKKRERKQTER